jgi:hypothetical protein
LSFCRQLINTFISRWDGLQWTRETTQVTAGPFACGSGVSCGNLLTSSALTGFGPLTLSSDLPYSINPLPVTWTHFAMDGETGMGVQLRWTLADPPATDDRFIPERSVNGIDFEPLASLPAEPGTRTYRFTDTKPLPGDQWYRVRLVAGGQTRSVSPLRYRRGGRSFVAEILVHPNPARGEIYLRSPAGFRGRVAFKVWNVAGKRMLDRTLQLETGSDQVRIGLAGWPAGIYYWQCGVDGSRSSGVFIKQ